MQLQIAIKPNVQLNERDVYYDSTRKISVSIISHLFKLDLHT